MRASVFPEKFHDNARNTEQSVINIKRYITYMTERIEFAIQNVQQKARTSGEGAPAENTKGSVGQIYVDTASGQAYICVSAGKTYGWRQITR